MKVFISHSSSDNWVARKISDDLTKIGIETFLDEKDIETGESIDDKIKSQLTNCDEILILLSPSSLNSFWVFIEIGGASVLKKRIVTVLLNVGTNEVPAPLTKYLARDINDIDKYYEELQKRDKGKKTKSRKMDKVTHRTPPKTTIRKGDWVKIIDSSLLTKEDKAKQPKWVDEMDRYSGMTASVIRESNKGLCQLDIDGGEFTWRAEWLVQIRKSKK